MKKTQQLISNLIQRTILRRRSLLIGLILVAGLALSATQWRKAQNTQAAAAFATITVTGTADGTLASLAGNGTCDLREAIQAANTNAAVGECTTGAAGLDTINFNLPGPSYTINVTSALPTISQAVVIEGAPFAGSADRVELNGAGAGAGVDGLRVTAGGSTIRGLVINRFTGDGIELNGSSGNVIEGCYLGTDSTGMSDQGNAQFGVNVIASTNNRVGGTTAAARNVISGNNWGGVQIDYGSNLIQGNYIGTDKDGAVALGNSGTGVFINSGAGATTTISGNLISGNAGNGIQALNGTTATIIRGNLVGTDKDGNLDLGNTGDGVSLFTGTNNIVGGTTPADRNVISGNNGNGLSLGGTSAVSVQGNYIGTNSAGTAALGNSRDGIGLGQGAYTIGGTTGTTPGGNCTGACNLVSGNGLNGVNSGGNNHIVLGNYIGTDVTGNADLGNGESGVRLNSNFGGIFIGGTTPEARNLISGNNEYGVVLVGGGATVQGNYIGTKVGGTVARGNSKAGIWITNFSAGNLIGGTTVGAGNVISGNDEDGIYINASLFAGSTNTIQGNLIGTDFTGTQRLGNTRDGIRMATRFLIIGGATAAARNVVSGNTGVGISSVYPSGSAVTEITIQGNYIGTDINGMSALGNMASGVYLIGGLNSLIGGTAVGEGNLIAANSHGIYLDPGTTNGPTVQGNLIGTDKNGMPGSPSLGNTANGIRVGQSNTTIGGASAAARNVIANNGENGIQVGSSSLRVAMRGNEISGNTKLGIDLAPTLPGGTVTGNDAGDGDGGPNLSQNFPVLDAITQPCTITGSLDSTTTNAAYPVRIEFFANTSCDPTGNGEGEVYLDFVVLNAPGSFSRSFTPVAGKSVITATATDNNGNTSEFSACRTAPVNQAPGIAPAGVARTEGQPGANSTIANITDANQTSNTLGVTINGQPLSPSPTLNMNGVTISNLAINAAGALTADVVAACGATSASFTLSATDNCSVTTPGALTVTVNPAPAAMANAGMDQAMCSAGATTTFTLAGSAANGSAAWSVVSGPVSITNPGALNSTAVFTGAGTATVRLAVTGSCGAATDEVVLTVNAPSVPTITASGPTTFCQGGSVTLTASAASSYLWSNGATTQSITVNAAGSYSVTVTDGNVCTGTSAATAVTVNPLPTPTIAASGPTTFCQGGSVTLTASAASSYLWSNGATTQAITVNAAGSYSVTVTDGNVCTGTSATTAVAVNPLPTPTITASGPTTFCQGGSVTLTASPASSYLWSNGATTQSITVNAAGSYSVTVSDGNGCNGTSAPTVVMVNPLPTAVVSGSAAICAGGSATIQAALTGAGPWQITWSDGVTQTATTSPATRIVSPASNTTYTITSISDANCAGSSTGSAAISITPAAMANAGSDQALCPAGATTTFTLAGSAANGTAAWSVVSGPVSVTNPGALKSTAVFTGTGAATLRLTVTNDCGAATDDVVLTVNANPSAVITGPAEICDGASATLDAGAGYSSYLWSNGATTQTITVSPNATTTYSVTVTNAAGCSGSVTKTITVNPRPVVTVNSAAICAGANPATMTATVTGGTAPFSYLWSGPGGFTASTQSINVSTAGVYTVSVTDAKGCAAASASGTLTVNPAPSATITAPAAICANSTGNAASVADAGAGASYNWTITGGAITSGQNTPNITWSAGASGTATLNVTVTNAAGCSATAPPKTVTINQPPAVTPLTNVTVNAGSAASFTTTASGAGPFSFVWKKGATVITTGGNITITSTATTSALNIASATAADAGNYSVEVTGACGPAATSNSAVLTVNQTSTGCVRSHGYWKNHAAQWPVSTLALGSQTYTKTELLALLGAPVKGDASIILAHQHIAAKLNIASGAAATAIAATIQAADNWLSQFSGKLPYRVASSSQQGQVAVNLAGTLDRYNNGTLAGGPPHCDSGAVGPTTASTRAVRNDFDGDGKSDLVTWRDADGRWLITHSSDGVNDQQWLGEKGDVPVPADYDGDGHYDLAVWRPIDGRWLIRLSQSDAAIERQWGTHGDSPAPADYDGDGQADLAVWRGSEGVWHILRSSDNQVETLSWGLASAPYFDVPVAADYDGDGQADIAVFRRANGRWYIRQSSDGSVVERQWGIATDTPVPDDYDGDGKTDIAVWRGTEGRWYIARSRDQTAQVITLEVMSLGDVPAPGDYDGDGQADAAIWRPGEGRWQVKRSRDGQTMSKSMAERGTNPTRPSSPERR